MDITHPIIIAIRQCTKNGRGEGLFDSMFYILFAVKKISYTRILIPSHFLSFFSKRNGAESPYTFYGLFEQ